MMLKERITEDMKAAMRAGEKDRLGVIRMLQAAIKQREVDERITLDDAQVVAVLEKMVTRRVHPRFQAGGRADLVAKDANSRCCRVTSCPALTADALITA